MTDPLDEAQNGVQEEAPKEEATPEATEEAKEEPVQEEVAHQQHQVPLHHLLNERQQKQELKGEIDALRKELEELRQSKIPEFDDDPKAYLDTRIDSLSKKVEQPSITPEQVRQEVEMAQTRQALAKDHTAVLKKHPDYLKAIEHVRQHFYQQHIMSGVDPQKIPEIIGQAEINMATDILARGGSPGETVYEFAVNQTGYKPPKKKESKEKEKIETIRKGQDSSTPIAGGDAGTPKTEHETDAFDAAFKSAFTFE